MLKPLIHRVADRFGVRILGKGHYLLLQEDMEPEFQAIYPRCKAYTMTHIERMYALYNAVRYVMAAGIPGALVECGVWRGGSAMMMAETLKAGGDVSRVLYLYDTYEGMSKPTARDITSGNVSPFKWFQFSDHQDYAVEENMGLSLAVPLEAVRQNMERTGYPLENIRLVKGKVEDTLPGVVPDQIALLRLDTDWYESTYQEMLHLYPRLARGGVLILDDYGFWKGSREAVDQYFAENGVKMLLNRVDHGCRIGIKID